MIGSSLLIVGAVIAYGVSTFFQSHAAERVPATATIDLHLLSRLARQRVYLLGVGCQLTGFVLAFFARDHLPLFLVQPAVAASLGVTLIIGIAAGRWHLGTGELGWLLVVAAGLACLGAAATASDASAPTPALEIGLTVAAIALMAIARPIFATRGRLAPVLLGGLSGGAFGAAAIAARALTNDLSPTALLTSPTSYLLVVHLAIGQYLFAAALQRRNVSGATASMYAVTTVSSAIVGLIALGDRWRPGMFPFVVLGVILAVVGALGLARYTTVDVSSTDHPVDDTGRAATPVDAVLQQQRHQ